MFDDALEIATIERFDAGTIEGCNDHRIVMAVSLLCTLTGGKIYGAEAVAKSLPDFFERLRKLGIKLKEETL